MKRLPLIVMLTVWTLLTACSSTPAGPDMAAATESPQPGKASMSKRSAPEVPDGLVIQDGSGVAILQKVAFHTGISSATVERLARRFGCTGSTGAGLITDKGPVEVYRMRCDNGTTFLAECELRQCRPLR